MPARRVTACVAEEDEVIVDFDVDMWLFAKCVIFDDEECAGVETHVSKACGKDGLDLMSHGDCSSGEFASRDYGIETPVDEFSRCQEILLVGVSLASILN